MCRDVAFVSFQHPCAILKDPLQAYKPLDPATEFSEGGLLFLLDNFYHCGEEGDERDLVVEIPFLFLHIVRVCGSPVPY